MRRRYINLLLFNGCVLLLSIFLLPPPIIFLLLNLPLLSDFCSLSENHLLQLLLLPYHLQSFLLYHLLLLLFPFLHLLKNLKVLLLEILSLARLLFFIEFFAISSTCQFPHKNHRIILVLMSYYIRWRDLIMLPLFTVVLRLWDMVFHLMFLVLLLLFKLIDYWRKHVSYSGYCWRSSWLLGVQDLNLLLLLMSIIDWG